jgi:hypothetical protein
VPGANSGAVKPQIDSVASTRGGIAARDRNA